MSHIHNNPENASQGLFNFNTEFNNLSTIESNLNYNFVSIS